MKWILCPTHCKFLLLRCCAIVKQQLQWPPRAEFSSGMSLSFITVLLFSGTLAAQETNSSPSPGPNYQEEYMRAGTHASTGMLKIPVFCDDSFEIQIRNNLYVQTLERSPLVKERIYIYPFLKQRGEVVYTLSCFENVSNETVPHVSDEVQGRILPSRGDITLSPYLPGETVRYPLPLAPGKRRLNWFQMLHELNFVRDTKNPRLNIGAKPLFCSVWVSSDFRFKGYLIRGYPTQNCPENVYLSGEEETLAKIQEWFSSDPLRTGDDVYDYYLGDSACNADENQLKSPSTVRDEIQLTRLILEYLHDEGTLEAVTDFVESRPFPQKIVMTFRLFRMDSRLNTFGDRSWHSAPPPLPEGWEAKLLKLNEKFREIRENALNE